MTKGVLLFANNNGTLNYIKQAEFLAKRIHKYLNLPVSLVTTSDYDNSNNLFDNIIQSTSKNYHNTTKRHHDGDLYNKITTFLNTDRADVYYLTPYDETIVMDTDYVISNDILNNCFVQQKNLLLYKDAIHVGIHTGTSEFLRISDTSIDFYWATVFYFKKSEQTKMFFDLVKHIKENYQHYRNLYQITSTVFRNDYAFSIAAHIMGYVKELPGKMIYSTHKDVLHKINNVNIKLLIEKQDRVGEYTLLNSKGVNLHVMNKFSLNREVTNA